MSDTDIQAPEVEPSLDELLNGHIDEVEADPAPAPTPAAEAQPVADAPTGEIDASPASEQQVPLAALTAEREKRQHLEQRVRELEARTQPAPERPKLADPLDDPEAFARQVDQAAEAKVARVRIELHQELMRAKHDDYDAREAKFIELAQADPTLYQRAVASGNVARFAYDHVVQAEKFERMQDVDKYESELRAKVEAEIRAKVEAELLGKAAKTAELQSALSLPSLATVGSGGSADVEPDLTSIIGADATQRGRR